MSIKDVADLLINANTTIRNALKCLNETGQKNLYIVNEEKILLGSLSDGDIRRGILKGIDLNSKVSSVMNSSPIAITRKEANKKKMIENILIENHLESVPIVDEKTRITSVTHWTEVFKKKIDKTYTQKENPIFILAGGFGTRLEPFTKVFPKPLIPIGETPMLEKIMDNFNTNGFSSFIVSLNYRGDMIKAYFSDSSILNKYKSISYIKESFPMGTIGSLSLAAKLINKTFFITNCDIIVEEDMEKIYEFHKEKKNMLTIVGCVKNSVIPYGVLKMDEDGNLTEFEEKPEYNHVINTGLYVAEPDVMKYISENKQKDITELIDEILKAGEKIGVYPVLDNQWFDVGQWAEFEETKKHFN